jgi:hypothetical protein
LYKICIKKQKTKKFSKALYICTPYIGGGKFMKSLHFALWVTIFLCLLGSCSVDDLVIGEQPRIEETGVDEPGNPSTGDHSTSGEEKEDPLAGDKSGDEPGEGDEIQENGLSIPILQINELRTEYSASQSRAEFIEFKANGNVNLDGMKVFIASNINPLVYEFLPVEIMKGEYFVLHMRTVGEGNIDEYGENLNESGGWDASPVARDFWIPGNTNLLRKTDIVYLQDKDGNIIDAVMIAENPDSEWPNARLSDAAEYVFNQGAWLSDPVNSSRIGSAATRSISRDELVEHSRTAADWYITANGGATPGLPNDPKRLD